MTEYLPRDPAFDTKVRHSFSKQGAMKTLGVSIASVEPGRVELAFQHADALTQHNGFIHAGIVTTAMDSACGYAGYTLMPAECDVLTIEFKTNFLAPARGAHYRAIGKVKKSGRTITVCDGELFACTDDNATLVASMTCTLMAVTRQIKQGE